MLDSDRCLIIAEVALAHDGSLGFAHAFVDAVARAGADAVKFQTHLAHAESTAAEPWRVRFSPQDNTRYDYWQRTAFTLEEWTTLAAHARQQGLRFLSSPFSLEAVQLLRQVGVDAWKIASGEMSNTPLIEAASTDGLPMILSSGLSDWEEIETAVDICRRQKAPLAVLQCTSAYPCPPERVGLNILADIRERFGCATGLSDHSGTIFPGLAAATLGADIVEVHVTLSREMFGPDVPASLTTGELRQLVDGVRYIRTALAHPVDKRAQAESGRDLRRVFTHSVVAGADLDRGHTLATGDLAFKKPGTGLPPSQAHALLGRRLRRAVSRDTPITEGDLEPLRDGGAGGA